jgi:erythromycin esterase-like protein
VRDLGMAKMVIELMSRTRTPDSHAVLWAHLLHVSREYDVGAPTMGYYLSEAFGAGYQAWALLAYEGSVNAREPTKRFEVVAHSLSPPPGYTLESVLMKTRTTPGTQATYSPFGPPHTRHAWLSSLHWIRQIGAAYSARTQLELYNMKALDGAALFPSVTPTKLLRPHPPS